MYGGIGWEISATDFSHTLNELSAKYETIILRLHTPGGSVVEGNLICNAIKTCKSQVVVHIDGLSASMGSIIMLAATRVEAAENSMIMIHTPSGYTQGGVKDHQASIKLLTSFEKSFKSALSVKTGIDDAMIQSWFDGADHWFTAAEAKELGLIDEVTDSVVEVNALSKPTDIVSQNSLYQSFAAALVVNDTNKNPNNNKTEKPMKEVLKNLGLPEAASEEQAVAALNELKAEVNNMKEAQIKEIVATAVLDKRITEDKRGHFVALGQKVGAEVLKSTFEAMSPAVKPIDLIHRANAAAGVQLTRKLSDMTAEEMSDMRTDNPEQYAAMYEAEYGFKPKN